MRDHRPFVIILSIVALALVVQPAAGVQGQTHRVAAVTRVSVGMTEYHFALSRKVMPRGTVIFTVVNKGAIVHSFAFRTPRSARTPVIRAGGRYVLRVTFAKPGRYDYFCAVGEHSYFGMQGHLNVK